jgi:hypothetical protein
MSDTYQAGLTFPAGGVTMIGVSDGGKLVLLCKSNSKNTFVFEEQIIATQVGSVGWRD